MMNVLVSMKCMIRNKNGQLKFHKFFRLKLKSVKRKKIDIFVYFRSSFNVLVKFEDNAPLCQPNESTVISRKIGFGASFIGHMV